MIYVVPGGGLELLCPTENKEVIENYASTKRRKLPIRGYLVRIRYTAFVFNLLRLWLPRNAHRAHSPFAAPVLANALARSISLTPSLLRRTAAPTAGVADDDSAPGCRSEMILSNIPIWQLRVGSLSDIKRQSSGSAAKFLALSIVRVRVPPLFGLNGIERR